MQSQIIEPTPELSLILVPAPGEAVRSDDVQSELGAFQRGLREQGVQASQRWFTQDAAEGGGWGTGEFVLVVSTLGPVAIVELRKLIVAFLKIRNGRKLKLKFGTSTIEGHVDDVQKLVTPEQISKLLEPPKKAARKSIHE